MIQQYKIQVVIDEIHSSASPTTRKARGGRCAQLQEVKTTMALIFNFYTNRLLNYWNKLADSKYTAPSTSFKNLLDIDKKGY